VRRTIALSSTLLALCLVAVACGSGGAKTGAKAPPASDTVTFPVRVVTTAASTTIPHKPSRIVSLSPTATQMVFAIGAGSQVVAVDAYSTYPPSAPRTTLSGFQPNVEAIAGYRPDLLLIESDQGGLVKSMAALHVPVVVQPAAKNLDDAYAQIVQLGTATGHLAEARSVIASLRRRIADTVASVPRPAKPLRLYHELDQTYYSATSSTFIGQIYAMFGLTNIADGAGLRKNSGYPQLSSEYVVSANPQLIVLADTVCCHQSSATVAARPGWSHIDAVTHGEVVGVEDSLASEWGPRIADFVALVAQVVKRAEATYSTGTK
jgi:iron complex transport system substrate-binding protein